MKFLIQHDVRGNKEVKDKAENTTLTYYSLYKVDTADMLTNSCLFTQTQSS